MDLLSATLVQYTVDVVERFNELNELLLLPSNFNILIKQQPDWTPLFPCATEYKEPCRMLWYGVD